MSRGVVLLVALVAALAAASPAAAGEWFPHPDGATWQYEWTDSAYQTTPTLEKVSVRENKAGAFTLEWTTEEQGNPPEAATSVGAMAFQDTLGGVVVTDWSSTRPPAQFPILCARATPCGNSLTGVLYNLVWGSRAPLLAEPLLAGATWSSTGGAENDVATTSEYLGRESITVPAFPQPVIAAKVRSDVAQVGALGDPYGSGLRTVWWVYGVGPVKIVFEHSGGANAPVTTVVLKSTNRAPAFPPSDANYFPLKKGLKGTFRWTNSKYLKKPSVQKFEIDEVLNASARFTFQSVSGPIKVAGAYGFTTRLDGVTNLWGIARAATLVKFPPLGPASVSVTKRRRFFTPFDLMTFGFNPLLPAYPAAGQSWIGKASGRDFAIYGATGTTRVTGIQKVKVPAGTFQAVAVQTVVRQPGFRFGSGTRTSWFAPGRGLVKLVFRHADGSVSRVDRIR